MTELLSIFGITFAAWGLTIPMRARPFSEDDGYWFYYSVFQKQGLELFADGYRTQGYFGLPWIFAVLGRIFTLSSSRSYQTVKAIWHWMTALSIFMVGQCLWEVPAISLAASLLFLIAVALPQTLLSFTYAEHFFMLPLALALTLIIQGGNSFAAIFCAGALTAWAVHIKVTFLPVAVLLPLAFPIAGTDNFILQLLAYCVGHATVMTLPFFLLHDRSEWKFYLHSVYGPVLHFVHMQMPTMSRRFRLDLLASFGMKNHARENSIHDNDAPSPDASDTTNLNNSVYVETMHKRARNNKWELFVNDALPAFSAIWILPLLATIQIPLLFLQYDPWVLVLLALTLIFITTQQIQQNYHMPHFNPVWLPIVLLAGKSLFDIWQADPKGTIAIFIGVLAASETIRMGWPIVRSYLPSHVNEMGLRDQRLGFLFRFAETVGRDLEKRSEPDDTLLVWGDQPSIHLVSGIPAFNRDSLFLYAHSGKVIQEDALLHHFRMQPPEWVLFFNWRMQDGKDIEYLINQTQVPYLKTVDYAMKGDDGTPYHDDQDFVWNFPLYRRDDSKFFDLCIDRGSLGQYHGYYDYRQQYAAATAVAPENIAVTLRKTIRENLEFGLESSRDRCESLLSDPLSNTDKSIIHTVLAESYIHYRDPEKMINEYQKALTLNPKNTFAMANLGRVLVEEGMFSESFGFLAKAFAQNPFLPSVQWGMARVFEENGDSDKAQEFYRKVETNMPTLPIPNTFRRKGA